MRFDASGNRVFSQESGHGPWKFEYDGLGHQTRVVEPPEPGLPNIVSSQIYDARGWVEKAINPLGKAVSFTRRHHDRPEVVTNPRGKKIETVYDAMGRTIQVKQPYRLSGTNEDSFYSTATSYLGGTGLPYAVTDAEGETFFQFYNTSGQRVALTNRRGHQWLFSYDLLGRQTAVKTPHNQNVHLQTWDDQRDVLISTREPSGQVTSYVEYDDADRLKKRQDGVGETTLTYDLRGRLIRSQENGLILKRSYSAASGQLQTYTNERGEKFLYSMTPDGLLTRITYPALKVPGQTGYAPPANKSVAYTYDDHKRLKTVSDWGGRKAEYSYDAAGRLVRLLRKSGSATIASKTWRYDDSGQIKEIREVNSKGQIIVLQTFAHDAVGRATHRLALPWAYGGGVSLQAEVGPDNRLTSVGGQPVDYDGDGNLLSFSDNLFGGSVTQFGFDARNRLVTSAMGGASVSYAYDQEGHRQSMTLGTGATEESTVYSVNPHAGLSQCVARRRGNAITWAVHGLGLLWEVEEVFNSATKPLKVKDVLFHHHDQAGNTTVVTNLKGEDVLWVRYDLYGQVVESKVPRQRALTANGSLPAPAGGAELTPARAELDASALSPLARALLITPYLYSGAHGVQTDPTGLIHMRARYYHPGIRRFINQDPIGFGGGMNWYAYADGNPLMNPDPSGLYAVVDDAIAGGIGAVVGLVIQGGMDVWHGQMSPGSHYLAAAAGGAVAGVGTLYLGPGGVGLGTATAAGIAGAGGAATSNVIRQTADISAGRQSSFSGTSLAVESAFGGAGGAIGSKVAPYILRPLSNQVKGMIGEGTSLAYNLAQGNVPAGLSRGVGWQVNLPGQNAVWDWQFRNVFSGATTIVESKFGTAGLTAAQKASAPFTSNLSIERWTYGFWSGAGGALGGISGAAAGRK